MPKTSRPETAGSRLFTGTTDAFSSTTNGTFATAEAETASNREPKPATPAAPAPTSVIAIEGESANSIIIATPRAIETESDNKAAEPDTVQVSATSALYAFPGDAEAATWLTANQERLAAGGASGEETFTEVPDAPNFGDDSVTFKTHRATGADEQPADGFRVLARVGAIVAVLDIASSTDLPLNDVAKLMKLQVDCIEAGGCGGVASLSGRLVEFEIVEPRSPVTTEPTQVPKEKPTRSSGPKNLPPQSWKLNQRRPKNLLRRRLKSQRSSRSRSRRWRPLKSRPQLRNPSQRRPRQ